MQIERMKLSSSSSAQRQDHIKINGLCLDITLPSDISGSSSKSQTLYKTKISLDIACDISLAARFDDVRKSVDYATIATRINHQISSDGNKFNNIKDVVDCVFDTCLCGEFKAIQEVMAYVQFTDPQLNAGTFGIQALRQRYDVTSTIEKLFISNMCIQTLIGVYLHERSQTQTVILDVDIYSSSSITASSATDMDSLLTRLSDHVEKSSYLTLETLATECARVILSHFNSQDYIVTVRISKPTAISGADSAEIQITRAIADFKSEGNSEIQNSAAQNASIYAVIGLGSNLGDRFQNIETALRMLEDTAESTNENLGVTIIDTSFMYETSPMYVVDQPNFINCACLVKTKLNPSELLALLKRIEKAVGRIPSVRFGPRAVDLDIITFGDQIIDTRSDDAKASNNLDDLEDKLVIPHPRMAEREFVLRPLNDIIPEWVHPVYHMSIRSLLESLVHRQQDVDSVMVKVTPFPSSNRWENYYNIATTSDYWTFPVSSSQGVSAKPYLMATLNVTPDSFSDGSLYNKIPQALKYTAEAVACGADIIDIGGYSTRPNAPFISVQDEIERVIPVIKAIRQADQSVANVLISVDTFRWDVARAAILAGANCINDVHAFSGNHGFNGAGQPLPTESVKHYDMMKDLAFRYGVPVIMMHSRGDAGTNKDYSSYRGSDPDIASKAVIRAIQFELGAKVTKAVRGSRSIRRWLVMADPGIGFSKTKDDNLELIRHASDITADVEVPGMISSISSKESFMPYTSPGRNPLFGFPLLIGCSRKSFLDAILSEPFSPGMSPGAEAKSHAGRETAPKERVVATAVAVACAVHQGAAVVRIHDVEEMADAIRVASALWK